MITFSRVASALAAGLIFGVMSNHAEGTRGATGDQAAGDCRVEALSDAAAERLAIYDKGLYLDPNCVNGHTPLPVHCNYMGLGQECRGCFLTCEGALDYMADFAEEIDVWGEDAIIHFCPGAEVDDLEEDCYFE